MQQAKKRFIHFLPSEVFIWILFVLLIGFSRSVDGNSTESLVENDKRREFLELEDSLLKEDEIDDRRKEALEDLQKIFGIRVESAYNSVRHKTPPQFMMELYNTIADPSGVTRGKNPYNAKIVRSFVERDTQLSHLYFFNISGLEKNESVIEAELHLFRKRSALKVISPTILRSPYYLIRVYQVLEGQSMDEPDVHRLLNVHYVGAYASGWQVFNVKQAVLAWIAGAPNLGLMVKASTLFGDEASIEFIRRNDYHHSKQPILVLFDDDGRIGEETTDKFDGVPHYYTYNDDQDDELIVENDTNNDNNDQPNSEEEDETIDSELFADYYSGSSVHRRKRQQDESEFKVIKTNGAVIENKELNKEIDYGIQLGNNLEAGKTDFFQRSKRISREKGLGNHQDFLTGSAYFKQNYYLTSEAQQDENNDKTINQLSHLIRRIRSAKSVHSQLALNPLDSSKFVTTKKTRVQRVLSSMDIYERDLLRENKKRKTEESKQETLKNYKRKQRKRFPRAAERDKEIFNKFVDLGKGNNTECTRHELYVDFQNLGLSNLIIAPKGYSAFHCQGHCDRLATHDGLTTNHADLRSIMYKMGLVREFHVPCCVPTKLFSISILFFDDDENVVLKVYEDMVVDRCGCR